MPNSTATAIRKILTALIVTFGLAVTGFAQATEKILYTFTGGNDGGQPLAGLVLDTKGNLYGTTLQGGANFAGTVFELTPNSNGTWTEQVIYNFNGFSGTGDGYFPYGTLVFDAKGNLYGTTSGGGANSSGTIFEVSPQSGGSWTESVLYSFTGGSDGGDPFAGVILDGAGNLYGTTFGGGAQGFGVAYELVAGAEWSQKVLHTFTGGTDGANPYYGSLAFGEAGNLYGESFTGGAHDYGVVYQLSPGSNGDWTEKIVHAFAGVSDGSSTAGNVVVDKAGDVFAESGFTVMELIPSANGIWTSKILHNFVGGSDGASPEGGLFLDTAGDVYGTTYNGGLHRGTVFKLTPGSGGTWTERILHKFTGGSDGDFPQLAPLTVNAGGTVYGTTSSGGTFNTGMVYEIKP
jgi:uncharacterized repeat protein (TIGR03803 family)